MASACEDRIRVGHPHVRWNLMKLVWSWMRDQAWMGVRALGIQVGEASMIRSWDVRMNRYERDEGSDDLQEHECKTCQ